MNDTPNFITEQTSGPDMLILEARFPHLTPHVLFDYWTQADLLRQWWPSEAVVEAYEGGSYVLSWPQMNWYLRGRYERFEPDRSLGFTWSWDHEPDVPESHVTLTFATYGDDGTHLTLIHGPYSDSPEGREQRAGNVEGWNHFLTKLYELQTPASPS